MYSSIADTIRQTLATDCTAQDVQEFRNHFSGFLFPLIKGEKT